MAKSTEAPAAPKQARARHWQGVLTISDAEHEAALIAGEIRVNVDITRAQYESALNRWRRGPA